MIHGAVQKSPLFQDCGLVHGAQHDETRRGGQCLDSECRLVYTARLKTDQVSQENPGNV